MEKKQKNNILKNIVIIIIVFFIIIASAVVINQNINQKKIELTQLQANSHRQMMGYIIKTSKDKIIVVTVSGRGDKDVAAIARYRGENLYD